MFEVNSSGSGLYRLMHFHKNITFLLGFFHCDEKMDTNG